MVVISDNQENHPVEKGMTGTVNGFYKGFIAVEFDEPFALGHGCCTSEYVSPHVSEYEYGVRLTKNGYGWWVDETNDAHPVIDTISQSNIIGVYPQTLSLIEPADTHCISVSASDLMSLI